MGWNDRLPDDPYAQTEDERESYEHWSQYQEYMRWLITALKEKQSRVGPKDSGLSSQTISPDSDDLPAIDIFGQRERDTYTPKKEPNGQGQEEPGEHQENSQARE